MTYAHGMSWSPGHGTSSKYLNSLRSEKPVTRVRMMTYDYRFAEQLGIGNHMFIYASTLGIARALNYSPVVRKPIADLRLSRWFELRSYTNVPAGNLTWVSRSIGPCVGCYVPAAHNYSTYVDTWNRWNKGQLNSSENSENAHSANFQLGGCLQSHKYFTAVAELLRNEDFKCKAHVVERVRRRLISLVENASSSFVVHGASSLNPKC